MIIAAKRRLYRDATRMRRSAATAAFVTLLALQSVSAQWVERTIPLDSGWNSVFLTVDPFPDDSDLLFAGLPIESVWTPSSAAAASAPAPCASPDDPDCLVTRIDPWQVWFPPENPASVANTLNIIRGGRVLLVKTTGPAVLHLVGTPNGSRTEWKSGFNLVGFHVVDNPEATPHFDDFFSASQAHAGARVFGLMSNADPFEIQNLGQTRIAPKRGYWVTAGSYVEYDGPLSIDVASVRGIDYAKTLREHTLKIENLASTPRDITISYQPSEPVPDPAAPPLAGDVPLWWLHINPEADPETQSVYEWNHLKSIGQTLAPAGAADSRMDLRIAVNRAAAGGGREIPRGNYQGIITIGDGHGFERTIPVAAQAASLAGLWSGRVSVDAVSWVTAPMYEDSDALTPRPTPSPFTFPILLHRNEGGLCKLVSEVTLMWRPDAIEENEGHYVLKTPSCLPEVAAQLVPGSAKSGEPFTPRMTTVAFSFEEDQQLTGSFETPPLMLTTTTSPGDRLNPFKHLYHPDHEQGYAVTRELRFALDTDAPDGPSWPQWGDSYLEGTYEETITGLHRDPIHVSGRFALRRVSLIGSLNDEQGGGQR